MWGLRSRGGERTARASAPALIGTSVQRYAPANPNRAHAATAASRRAGQVLSDRPRVVVLVLLTVVSRIVVPVSREVDLVEHRAHLSRLGGQDGFDGALRQAAAGHLRTDHED